MNLHMQGNSRAEILAALFMVAKPTCLSIMGWLNKNSGPCVKRMAVTWKEAGLGVLVKAAERHHTVVSALLYVYRNPRHI